MLNIQNKIKIYSFHPGGEMILSNSPGGLEAISKSLCLSPC
jgi:hypothetical protein